ncbi:NLR family CARD domain-containing protein 3-like [Carassius auratus]|uniref:NLR family CARD domain-containing protein 3-like n=1 Tax=Carassius auratus TaxID=7957 RepID=A0A6P6QWG8_CARAU|nr:NLR family CARD domain-containing protein 3-like [Carassius auratus]XP_026137742.1 NLR family CARD domain-containing protein 3-like [Carassius auratus]
MAVGSCSTEIQQRRVELVEDYSKHLTHLLDVLFNVGAVTEEDLSFIKGSAVRGERECMRVLLDVLNGRGEESCRAFLYVLPSVQDMTAKLGQATRHEHLKKHKDILARQHGLVDYLSIRRQTLGQDGSGCWTDITFSRQAGYALSSQCRHESAGVGDASRTRLDEICIFKDLYENLLCNPASGVNMLSGVAGSGKTMVVRRLVREWAAETNSSKTVLSLSFLELNLVTHEQSLQDLLSDHYIHLKPFLPELLNSNPTQFLLILDGLDEFCYPLNFEHTPKCSDPDRLQPIQSIVVNLIKGNLLPGMSIFLTSRPHAVTKVPPVLVSQFYSLLGFSVAQQKQYFERNCSSPEAAKAVWASVSSHKPLLLMCHIPAFCWIVSTTLHDGGSCLCPDTAGANSGENGGLEEANQSNSLLGPSEENSKPVTISEIYCCFVKSILLFHVQGRSEGSSLQHAPHILGEIQPILKSLGAMAFKGLLERRFIFESSDLNSFNLDNTKLSQVFLSEILKEDRASLTFEKGFHFIHTSLQEFLAALYYVLQLLSGSNPFSGLRPSTGRYIQNAFKQMASAFNKFSRPQRLFCRRIKKALRCGERHQSGHMDLFCRFVCGLLVPRTRLILNGFFPDGPKLHLLHCQRSPDPTPPFLLHLLHSQLQSSTLSPERKVNIYHCLYEAQDPGLSQRLQSWMKVLSQQALDQSCSVNRDWSELAFLLQLTPDLQVLNLDAQGLDADGLRRLLPVLPRFSTLSLGQNPLGSEGASVLSLVLRNPDCRIQRLWVVATGLGCEGLKILVEALKENRTVTDLRMAINKIGDVGAGYLAELLKTNRTLTDIRLRDNLVTDEGAEVLMAALKENTTLEYLWLFDNKLTKDGVKKLKEFANTRPNLDIKACV